MARTFSHYERCIDTMRTRHPDMPRQSVVLMRLGYHLFRTTNERLDAFFATHGLSASAWAVLIKIYSSPDQAVTPSEISTAVVQSRTHMTRVADELVADGLIERSHDQVDRRRVVLRLTPHGVNRIQQLIPLVWAEYETMLAVFSADEAAQLEGLLRRWLTHLELHPLPAEPKT